ncbi:MAG: hypothetical protein V1874_08890 [Spirochaetota bacterium]
MEGWNWNAGSDGNINLSNNLLSKSMKNIINKIDVFLHDKRIFNRPLGLWVVLIILGMWSIAKAVDYIMFIFGAASIPEIIASTVIIPINLYCITGLWNYKRKAFEAVKYWLWLSYILAVFILPGYVSVFPEERGDARLLMAVIMSPVLIAWIILRFSSLKSMFKDDENKKIK